MSIERQIEFLGKTFKLDDLADGTDENIQKQVIDRLVEKNLRQLKLLKRILSDPRI